MSIRNWVFTIVAVCCAVTATYNAVSFANAVEAYGQPPVAIGLVGEESLTVAGLD